MPPKHARVAEVERSLEQLFRLAMGRRALARQAAHVGAEVSRGGYGILRILDDSAPISMSDIARTGGLDPATTARQVNALERAGLAERIPSDDDARIRLVRPTARGTRAYRRIADLRVDYLKTALAKWSVADRSNLVELVDRLARDLSTTPYDTEATT